MMREPSLFDEAPAPKPMPVIRSIGKCGECGEWRSAGRAGSWCELSMATTPKDEAGCRLFEEMV